MIELLLSDSPWVVYGLIPVLIVIARIVDVSVGTVRIVYIIRGHRVLAAILGFIESMIWLIAIVQIMQNITNPLYYITFAGGFAIGNYVGLFIEEKLAIGNSIIRIITQREADELVRSLNSAGYGVTHVDARGATSDVKIIYSVVKREDMPKVLRLVREYNPRAFYTIEDVQFVRQGIHSPSHFQSDDGFLNWLRIQKKK
jgi:uncharacterized protein YebE (UPF0316 family)